MEMYFIMDWSILVARPGFKRSKDHGFEKYSIIVRLIFLFEFLFLFLVINGFSLKDL